MANLVIRRIGATVKLISNLRFNSNRSCISKIHREIYERKYPTVLVFEDGSTITVRYHEPQSIIKLPLDLSKLSEQEKKLQLERRKPKAKVVIEDEIEDDFDSSRYLKLTKK